MMDRRGFLQSLLKSSIATIALPIDIEKLFWKSKLMVPVAKLSVPFPLIQSYEDTDGNLVFPYATYVSYAIDDSAFARYKNIIVEPGVTVRHSSDAGTSRYIIARDTPITVSYEPATAVKGIRSGVYYEVQDIDYCGIAANERRCICVRMPSNPGEHALVTSSSISLFQRAENGRLRTFDVARRFQEGSQDPPG
jgi:hypothetical protein